MFDIPCKQDVYNPVNDVKLLLRQVFEQHGPQALLEAVQTVIAESEALVVAYNEELHSRSGAAQDVLDQLTKLNSNNLPTADISIENLGTLK